MRPSSSTTTSRPYRSASHRGRDFLGQREAVITRRGRWDILTGLHAPTLVLWGRRDQLDTARAIAARVRDPRLVVLDDCGHLPTLEEPEGCVLAVRAWLTAVAEQALGAPRC